MKGKWIDIKVVVPKLDDTVLVWVEEDQQCFDIAIYDTLRANNNGFICNLTPNNYRNITHWQYLPNKPKIKNK